jgi:hypothetical protein
MSVDEMIERLPGRFIVAFLYLFNLAESSAMAVLDFWERLKRAFYTVTRPNYFIFFEGSANPHRFYETHYWATGSASPELLYCSDTKTFFPWIPRHSSEPKFDILGIKELYRPLPILSLEIVDSKDHVAYDLTDFVEGLRHVTIAGFTSPTLFHILSAWTLSSAVVPNLTNHSIRYVDSNGDSQTIQIYHSEESAPVEEAVEAESKPVIETESATEPVTEEKKEETETAPAAAET